jgi:hypothetical protein
VYCRLIGRICSMNCRSIYPLPRRLRLLPLSMALNVDDSAAWQPFLNVAGAISVVLYGIYFNLFNDENLSFDLHEYRWSGHRHSNNEADHPRRHKSSATPPPQLQAQISQFWFRIKLSIFLSPSAMAKSSERTRQPPHLHLTTFSLTLSDIPFLSLGGENPVTAREGHSTTLSILHYIPRRSCNELNIITL